MPRGSARAGVRPKARAVDADAPVDATAPVVVRRATAADIDDLVRLARSLNRHEGEPTDLFTAAVARRHGFGRRPEWTVWLAEVGGEAVGFAMTHLSWDTPNAAPGLFLSDLYVAPKARRLGVGRMLMAAVAAEVKRRKRVYFWWTAKPGNKRALAFYKSLGAFSEPVVAHALFGPALDRLLEPRAKPKRATSKRVKR
jgi:ribosomal protein S18 acetylase RimI-like enzyme